MTIKSRTLRLPADQAEALEAIAGVDEVSVNEEIQRAITAHIEARRSDPDFRRRLKASIERNREILERLRIRSGMHQARQGFWYNQKHVASGGRRYQMAGRQAL